MKLEGSQTAKNLMISFAGESQANMRYTYYAAQAKKDGYVQIQNVFEETARNEKEHAKRFYKFLRDEMEGEAVPVLWDYPVNYADTKSNLAAAYTGEHEEATDMYPKFADVAEEEGFAEIAQVWREIAEAESWHERRFKKLYENITDGTVFRKGEEVYWKCNNCGYVAKGLEAPELCPACAHPQAHFEVYCENY